MLTKIKNVFQKNPVVFYSMCIAATWAGGNSLIIGMTTAQENGIIPFLLWAVANMLAPIVFGLLALKIPKFQKTMESKPIMLFLTIICIFQIWLQMNNIQSTLAGTQYISNTVSIIIAIVLAVLFIILFLKDSFPRNVLTDNYSWWIVYLLILVLKKLYICSYSSPSLTCIRNVLRFSLLIYISFSIESSVVQIHITSLFCVNVIVLVGTEY